MVLTATAQHRIFRVSRASITITWSRRDIEDLAAYFSQQSGLTVKY